MDSMDKYGGGPFEGVIAKIKPSLQQMVDALVPVIQGIIDALAPTIKQCSDTIIQLWEAIAKTCPDKRVVWLAFHHKKARVRKKNMARIAKYITRELKSDDYG